MSFSFLSACENQRLLGQNDGNHVQYSAHYSATPSNAMPVSFQQMTQKREKQRKCCECMPESLLSYAQHMNRSYAVYSVMVACCMGATVAAMRGAPYCASIL